MSKLMELLTEAVDRYGDEIGKPVNPQHRKHVDYLARGTTERVIDEVLESIVDYLNAEQIWSDKAEARRFIKSTKAWTRLRNDVKGVYRSVLYAATHDMPWFSGGKWG